MAPGDDTSQASLDKEEVIPNSELKAPASQLSPSQQAIYENVNQHPSGDKEVVDKINCKHVRDCSNNFLALVDSSPLDYMIPTRTLSRTLTTTGRESILNRFRQRRSVERDTLVHPILEGLGRDEVKAVYDQNKPRKEFERSRIDHSRMIWKRQANWLAMALDPFLIPESTEEGWQSIKCTEGTKPVDPNPTDGHAENAVASTKLEQWGPCQPWGSDGIVWSPGSRSEWGDSDEESDLTKDAPGYNLRNQGQELKSDTGPLMLSIVDEENEKFDGYRGEEEDEQAREEDEDEVESGRKSKLKDRDLFAVPFEFPGWYSTQGQDETATKPETETPGDIFEPRHKTTLNSEPNTDSTPLWPLEQSLGCNTHGPADGHTENQSGRTHGVSSIITFQPQRVAEVLRCPVSLHSLGLLEAKLPDRNAASEVTYLGEGKHQHGKSTPQDNRSQEEASHASLPLKAIFPLPAAHSSPTEPASPILPHNPAVAVEELAEKLLPFVVDKNGYMFECILKDGVKLLKNRASDRFGLRDRPRLSPSGLCEAWTLGKGTSNDAAENTGQ